LGVAAILLGIITWVWHDFNGWQQIDALGKGPHREILAYIVGAVEILAGLAVQWPRTTRAGALTLACVFSFFAVLWIPRIVATPLVYDPWGNFFEQSSQVAGAVIVYAAVGRANADGKPRLARLAYFLFAICVISFMLEQLISIIRHGIVRAQVDSTGADVLGHPDYDCVRAGGDRAARRTAGAPGSALDHGDDRRLRTAGLASCAICESAPTVQLGG
jgi:uncharacterized membrane protein YphA (DoxX/SURF4 family)